jgi:hypothetical protein
VALYLRKPKLDSADVLGFADAIAQQNDAIADIQRNRYGMKTCEVKQTYGQVSIGDGFNPAIGPDDER